MAKHTNTSGADDLWLRYVLNELDPSEERLVEQAMLEDENVLIEIESLRITLKKLNGLPQFAPPPHLRQQLLQQAAAQAEINRKQSARRQTARFLQFYAMPAAAVIIVALGLGFFYYMLSDTQPAAGVSVPEQAAAVTNRALTPNAVPERIRAAEFPDVHMSGFGQAAASVMSWTESRGPMRIQVTNGVTQLTPSEVRFSQFQNKAVPKPADRSAFEFTSKPRDFHLIQTAR